MGLTHRYDDMDLRRLFNAMGGLENELRTDILL